MKIKNVINKNNLVYVYGKNNKLLFAKDGSVIDYNEDTVTVVSEGTVAVYDQDGEYLKPKRIHFTTKKTRLNK